jgi:hypothetical protein
LDDAFGDGNLYLDHCMTDALDRKMPGVKRESTKTSTGQMLFVSRASSDVGMMSFFKRRSDVTMEEKNQNVGNSMFDFTTSDIGRNWRTSQSTIHEVSSGPALKEGWMNVNDISQLLGSKLGRST